MLAVNDHLYHGGGDHVATGLLWIDPLSMPGVAM